jgi:hypothetical protein
VRGREPRVHALESREPARDEDHAHEQHRRAAHLQDHERAAHASVARARRERAWCSRECAGQIARRDPPRNHAAHDDHGGADGGAGKEDLAVEPDRRHPREIDGTERAPG